MASFENAMRYFEEAEKIRPQGNDDALLRWNRCLRLIQSVPELAGEAESFEASDAPPIFRINSLAKLVTFATTAESFRQLNTKCK